MNMPTKIRQIKNSLIEEIKASKHCGAWFYEEHLLVVKKLALDLCDLYPQANRDAVILSVWFHDIGRAHGHDENHDLYGADYARKILTKNNFDQDLIKLVVNSCKTHSCEKNGKPESLEGKILATADALSHYHNGHFLRIFNSWSKNSDEDYHELKKKLFEKIKNDFTEKIFFTEVKQAIKPMYQAWQKILEPVNLNKVKKD